LDIHSETAHDYSKAMLGTLQLGESLGW
jgi:hypothetical protein